MTPMAGAAHWNDRYQIVGSTSVSWFQETPSTSLEMLEVAGVTTADSVIDVGGGASTLVDHLLGSGHTDLAVLDLSAVALDVARDRVGPSAAVSWLTEDLLTWLPDRTWDVWHDRAVLHFLLTDDDRQRYVATMRRAVGPGGVVIIGTFAEDGPTECSTLQVRRHSPAELRDLLGDVEVLAEHREVHETPGGATQLFNWIAARLREENR